MSGAGEAECSFQKPATLGAAVGHRLSSSVGEVLNQTGSTDLEPCDTDLLRPLTSCEGDFSRSFSYLEWVHENQARRMRSRSEWFLTPAAPMKSSSHPGGELFTLKLFPGSFSFARDKGNLACTSEAVPLLPKKCSKATSYMEHSTLQAKKGRQPLAEKTCIPSSPKNIFPCTISSTGLPSSCGARRRSWRVRSLKPNLLGLKTHSLDSEEPPLLPNQRVTGKGMYSRPMAHSIGGETWIMEMLSDEIWKKRRNSKKKH